jgi:hypothetical protein
LLVLAFAAPSTTHLFTKGDTMKRHVKVLAQALCILFFVAACSAPSNTPESDTPDNTLEAQATFSFCANEYESCNFVGSRRVRFGDDTNYVTKRFFGFVSCKSQYFDNADPNPGKPKTCKVSSTSATTTLSNPMPGMGSTSANVIVPLGHPGYSDLRVRSTSEQPAPFDGSGAFRVSCAYSHMNFDDAIVYPGRPGAAHLHTYFGNKNANADSTASSIASSGNSTCSGGTANRSAYWVPTLLDGNGQPVTPSEAQFYYKTGYQSGITPSSIKAFPAGLRMIAGDMRSSSPQDQYKFRWNCLSNSRSFSHIPNAGECGRSNDPIGDFKQIIGFPQCWNGRDLDSADHKSHMAYPVNGACPSTHPVAVPEITFNIFYKIPSTGTTGWRLSSDMYSTSQRGGYSTHGDWMNGWNSSIMNQWIKNCENAAKDYHMGLLGGGKEVYGLTY